MNMELKVQIAALVEEYRDRCLWFLRDSFVPSNTEEALHTLDLIERYGDRSGFERARKLRKWLLHHTSAQS